MGGPHNIGSDVSIGSNQWISLLNYIIKNWINAYLTSLNIQQGPNVRLPTLVCPHDVPIMIANMIMQIRIDGVNLIM